jgi:hypothetical protein
VDSYTEKIRRFADWAPGHGFEIEAWTGSSFPKQSLETFRKVVTRAAQLQLESGAGEEVRREWIVETAEDPDARFHAFNELMNLKPEGLTDSQRSRLAAAFVRSPRVGFTDFAMLRLLRGRTDPQVDRTAASVVEAGLQREPIPDWVVPLVEEVLWRHGDDLKRRIGREEDDAFWPFYLRGDDGALATIWESARHELGIPIVAPAQAPPP